MLDDGKSDLPLVLTRPGPDTYFLVPFILCMAVFGAGSLVLGISNLPDPVTIVIFFFSALTSGLAIWGTVRLQPRFQGPRTLTIDSRGVTYTRPPQYTLDIPWGDMAGIGFTGLSLFTWPLIPAIMLGPAATVKRAAIKGAYSNPGVIQFPGPWEGPSGTRSPQEIARMIDTARTQCTGAPSIHM